jgi:hypothetical protein
MISYNGIDVCEKARAGGSLLHLHHNDESSKLILIGSAQEQIINLSLLIEKMAENYGKVNVLRAMKRGLDEYDKANPEKAKLEMEQIQKDILRQ